MEQNATFKNDFTEVRVLIIVDKKKLLRDKYCVDAKISYIADKLDTTRNSQKLLVNDEIQRFPNKQKGSTQTRPLHKHDRFGSKYKNQEISKKKKEVHFASAKSTKCNIQDRHMKRLDPKKIIGGSSMKRLSYYDDAKISVVLDTINCTDITMGEEKTLDTNNNYNSSMYSCDGKRLNGSDNSNGIQSIHETEINQKTGNLDSQFPKHRVFSEFLKDSRIDCSDGKYGREGLNGGRYYCEEARLSVCTDSVNLYKCVKSGLKNKSWDKENFPDTQKSQHVLLTDDMLAKMKKLFKNVSITPKGQRKDEKQEFDIRKVKIEPTEDNSRIEARSSSSEFTSLGRIKQEPMTDIKCEPSDDYDTVDIKREPSDNYDTVDIKCEPSDDYDTVDIKCEPSDDYDTVDIKCEPSDNYTVDIKCEPADSNDIVESVSKKTDICELRTAQALTTDQSVHPAYRLFKISPEVTRIEPVVNRRNILASNVNSKELAHKVQSATHVGDNSTKRMESMHQHATNCTDLQTTNRIESTNLYTDNRIEDTEFEIDCDNDYIVIDEWSSDET
ncbi:Hypothetical predicted protein [Mytilus galloprovincialis]|uniref:Uncharacterized protein n=1 Tax=Mytilus galloprovincialis TaxID=29158 RepID=A0A8B6CJ88_MYTGA|nr:Hypothetical predicted protein [Mytilus galloprovincialis]